MAARAQKAARLDRRSFSPVPRISSCCPENIKSGLFCLYNAHTPLVPLAIKLRTSWKPSERGAFRTVHKEPHPIIVKVMDIVSKVIPVHTYFALANALLPLILHKLAPTIVPDASPVLP